ncbi:MAG: hypothetical protein N4A74_22765, partial [Carboxylicivirga sp.]|nr:hypothetical protein [Carboxylicivirga sp.]
MSHSKETANRTSKLILVTSRCKQFGIVLMMIFFCIKLSAQNHSFNARPHYVNIKANSIPLPYQQITVECWLK